jgi:hypothetical protein
MFAFNDVNELEHDVTVLNLTIVHDTHLEQRDVRIIGGAVEVEAGTVFAPESLARIYQTIDRHASNMAAQMQHAFFAVPSPEEMKAFAEELEGITAEGEWVEF